MRPLTHATVEMENGAMSVPTSRPQPAARPLATSASPAPSPARQKPASDFLRPPYPIRRFTVAEYEQIARADILDEDSNVELLEGWIVPKMTKYPPHDGTIDLVVYLLNRLLPAGWFPRVQNVIVTPDSEPEPDVAIVRGKPGDYRGRHPSGSDIGLIVEVADSTVRRDRRKAGIYARAGIPSYWIVNLDDGQIETYADAVGKGKRVVYQSRKILLHGENDVTLVLDGKDVGKLRVGDLLPPTAA